MCVALGEHPLTTARSHRCWRCPAQHGTARGYRGVQVDNFFAECFISNSAEGYTAETDAVAQAGAHATPPPPPRSTVCCALCGLPCRASAEERWHPDMQQLPLLMLHVPVASARTQRCTALLGPRGEPTSARTPPSLAGASGRGPRVMCQRARMRPRISQQQSCSAVMLVLLFQALGQGATSASMSAS